MNSVQKKLKKLKGLRFFVPSGATVLTNAIGRGATALLKILKNATGPSVAGSKHFMRGLSDILSYSFFERGGLTGGIGQQPDCSAMTLLVSCPTPGMSTVIVSPGTSHRGGVIRPPMPGGVPVAMMSPGCRVMKVEM